MAKDKEKDDDKDKGSQEPELVIVTDDEKNLEVQPGPQTDDDDVPRQKKKAEEPTDEQDDEPDEEQEEARLGQSEELEREQEARDQQKSAHKSRRKRQKEAERRLRTERDFLEKRNEQLEKRVMALEKRTESSEKDTLAGRISYTKQQIERAEKLHADATTAGKGEEATEALKIRDRLRDSLKGMEDRHEKMTRPPADEPEPPPPAVIENVRTWMGRTTWFDPQLRDQDSRVVRALDMSVGQEGFDPGTPEYFEELDRRIAKYLPHRAKKGAARHQDADDEDIDDDQEDERPQRRQAKPVNGKRTPGGPRFRTAGPGQLKDNEVFLSQDRIAAMKDAGAWDDPVLRQKYLKRYRDWDREHADELGR